MPVQYLTSLSYKIATVPMKTAQPRPLKPPPNLKDRLREIRRGFEPAFWVANTTELFERLAYDAQYAVLAILLHESLASPPSKPER